MLLFALTVLCGQLHVGRAYITGIAERLPLKGTPSPPGSPWPMPHQWLRSADVMTLDARHFEFRSNLPGCDVIQAAFRRYSSLVVLRRTATPDQSLQLLTRLVVTVGSRTCDNNSYPQDTSSESYTISIGKLRKSANSKGSTFLADSRHVAYMRADTIWGAVRGLETFSQLVYLTADSKYRINMTYIADQPRFHYRGLLIDTARHFLPVNIILKVLDAMSWDKLNVLHWHVVDDQAFPYPSRAYPNLTEYGAYSAKQSYSRRDVNTIIAEARLRAIRVIPEFDTPGHSRSWGKALPELLTPCWGRGLQGGPNVPKYPLHGAAEVLNPMNEYTYMVLDNIYREITTDFPDQFVHLGLDEVYRACWKSNPNITQWMRENGMVTYKDVEAYYIKRLMEIVAKYNAKCIIWQDPIDNDIPLAADTVVVVWKTTENGPADWFRSWRCYMNDITQKGYRVILAAPWYLNVISYGEDWKRYYQVEPTSFTNSSTLQSLVDGGVAAVWAEYIDGSNLLSVVWPRVSAVAERLWSSERVASVDDAQFRLDQHRCRMVRRGIPAKPILPGFCGDYDWGMDADDLSTISSAQLTNSYSTTLQIAICIANQFLYVHFRRNC